MMKPDWAQHSSAQFDALQGERIDTIDMHTAGEPLRIIVAAPWLPQGEDILAAWMPADAEAIFGTRPFFQIVA
jgi:hypothetical protein